MGRKKLTMKNQQLTLPNYDMGQIVDKLRNVFMYAVGKDEGVTMGEMYREVYGKIDVNQYLRLFKIHGWEKK